MLADPAGARLGQACAADPGAQVIEHHAVHMHRERLGLELRGSFGRHAFILSPHPRYGDLRCYSRSWVYLRVHRLATTVQTIMTHLEGRYQPPRIAGQQPVARAQGAYGPTSVPAYRDNCASARPNRLPLTRPAIGALPTRAARPPPGPRAPDATPDARHPRLARRRPHRGGQRGRCHRRPAGRNRPRRVHERQPDSTAAQSQRCPMSVISSTRERMAAAGPPPSWPSGSSWLA